MFENTITTDRLLLRPPSVEDADMIYERWTSRPEATRFLQWETHSGAEQTRDFLTGCQKAWQHDEGRYPWVIAKRDDPNEMPVGMIELNRDDHRLSVGYIVGPDFWGQGIATEALSHLVDISLDKPAIWRVYATTDTDNTASARVMEKAGMQREGRLRRYAVRPRLGDSPRDAFIYAAVR